MNNNARTLLVASLIAIALIMVLIATTYGASATPESRRPPPAVRAYHVSARIGQVSAANLRCGYAQHRFTNALRYNDLPNVRAETRNGWRALRRCRSSR